MSKKSSKKKSLTSLNSKKSALAAKLLTAVMGQMDNVSLTEERYVGDRYRKFLRDEVNISISGKLMKEVSAVIDAEPPVTITVQVAARDTGKVKTNVANSCMTEKTKKSILAALKAKGVE